MLGFYCGRSLVSRAIRWRTWSKYSHVSWIDSKDMSVYEAWYPEGVRQNPNINFGHTPGTRIDLFSIKGMTDEHRDSLRSWLRTQIGKPYDLWAILGFVLRRELQDEDAWICSELIFRGMQLSGIDLLSRRITPSRVSPELLSTSVILKRSFSVVVTH